ncbi:MAG: pyridoxal phosphate-dependent aminotransferase [Candidatus Omnitrophica bacterium]|nr:pyridoxal phosphate-dependent aminotransferase [Candidatus Omnitrophota bacterium]MBI3021359.1 pyridoxal phosphate-dependent aminotransferase [Candidatus Omnitrophota bacterium]
MNSSSAVGGDPAARTFRHANALAGRLRGIEGSPTLALAAKAKALAKAGKRVLDLTAGEPDFPTPAHVKQAGIQAIQADQTKYTPVAGIPELRAAVATCLNQQHRTNYQTSHVLVSCGAKHALFNIFQALCQSGDEVVIFSPYWVSYPPLVQLAGAKPVIVHTSEQDQFLPKLEAVRAALSQATKVIVLNSPSNPTGAIIDAWRLKAIAQLALERDLVVVSDEIYDQLVYPPARHVSIVRVAPEVTDRTLLVGGVSKTYSMTGWRIGYAVGPQPWIEAMTNVQSHSTSNATSISQHAALAALTQDQQAVSRMREEFQERRNRLVGGLNHLPPLRCILPGGAFYAWCNVSGLGQSAELTAAQWLEDALVATVPGEGFGAPGFIRLSFAASLATIDETLERLGQWLKKRRP